MIESATPLTPAAARRALRHYRASSIPVRRVGLLLCGERALPVAELDARKRPDVADLPRIHRSEGAGDQRHAIHAVLTPTGGIAVIALSLERPVRCRFSLVLDLAEHFDWLTRIARCGLLVTTTRPVATAEDALGSGVAWEIDPAALGDVLTAASLAALARECRR